MNRRNMSMVMLVVIMFHSFVLVPKAHATSWEWAAARQVFKVVSPAAVAAAGTGSALLLAIAFGAGIDYVIFKSGAITALKNWWNDNMQYPSPISTATVNTQYAYTAENGNVYWIAAKPYGGTGTWHGYIGNSEGDYGTHRIGWAAGPVYLDWGGTGMSNNAYGGSIPASGIQWAIMGATIWVNNNIGNGSGTPHWGTTTSPSSSPVDIGATGGTSPTFPAGSVIASPGAAARIASGVRDYGVEVSWLTDAQAGAILDAFNGKTIASDGSEVASTVPEPTDNTMTAGDSQSIGLLQGIYKYVASLLGIKSDTGRMANTLDNTLTAIQTMSGKLDNVGGGSFPQAAQNALDNIGVNTQAIASKADNIATLVQGLSETTGTAANIKSRMSSLRDIAATKFPFSIGAALIITNPSGGHMNLGTFHLGPVAVDIAPLGVPLVGTLLTTARMIFALFLYAGTLFAIIRRVDSL
jgi:hypothetical protein